MPQKKKQVKKNLVKKKMFVLAVVVGLLLLVWISSMSAKNLSLVCTNSGGSITCMWAGCQPSAGSELILAKPSYVKSVTVYEQSGSAVFPISSSSGTYTALLYCDNGEMITTVSS